MKTKEKSSCITGAKRRILLHENAGGGTSSYHPKMLLKVLAYSYLNNLFSSRETESACKENIHLMWLSGMSPLAHNLAKLAA